MPKPKQSSPRAFADGIGGCSAAAADTPLRFGAEENKNEFELNLVSASYAVTLRGAQNKTQRNQQKIQQNLPLSKGAAVHCQHSQ